MGNNSLLCHDSTEKSVAKIGLGKKVGNKILLLVDAKKWLMGLENIGQRSKTFRKKTIVVANKKFRYFSVEIIGFEKFSV